MKHAISPAILKSHSAFLGKTGSGKTSLTKLAVEQVVDDGARVCVLDTLKSDWWGITSSASGKNAGLPFRILGGPRGHVPLHSTAGKVVGQLVGQGKLPLSIVDMADFEPGGIQRFFVDFAQALWKHQTGVVYLVIEEAHEIAPKERAGFNAENMAIHWAKKLATGGRTKGIRLMVATQRAQALHNAVLGSCETLFAMRLTAPADKEPVIGWLKDNASKDTIEQVRASLSKLPTGSGWVCSGEADIFELISFPKFRTYDNTATPEGDGDLSDVKTMPVDRAELMALIGDEAAKAEASDPAKLRERIARLERDNAQLELDRDTARSQQAPTGPSGEDIAAAMTAAEMRGFKAGFDEAANQGAFHFNALRDLTLTTFKNFASSFEANLGAEKIAFSLEEKYTRIPSGSPPDQRLPGAPQQRAAIPAPAARKPSPAASGDGSNSPAMTKMLTAMVELASLGVHQPKREMVAAMADYTNIQSRPIRDAFSQSLSYGWTTSPSPGRVQLTNIGRAQVLVPPSPMTAAQMRNRIAAAIGSTAGRVLDLLIQSHPQSMTREEIAAACNYSNIQSRPIRDAFSQLIDMGFVSAPAAGQLIATEALFP